jgi:hypothetical protein
LDASRPNWRLYDLLLLFICAFACLVGRSADDEEQELALEAHHDGLLRAGAFVG